MRKKPDYDELVELLKRMYDQAGVKEDVSGWIIPNATFDDLEETLTVIDYWS